MSIYYNTDNQARPPELIEALLKPGIYPENPQNVEFAQTQMSFVFLTGKHAYKIKKPVNLGYLDYTTLEKRHYFCKQELQLNRRLSPEVYLEVIPITRQNGKFHLDGPGEAVEYAVKMKQLPRGRTMDMLLANDEVSPEMVAMVAAKLVPFHREAGTGGEINGFGQPEAVQVNIDENYHQTAKYQGISISPTLYSRIQAFNARFMQENRQLFQRRIAENKIRDCHGDLHCAHVCFSDAIYIFDCIEFNDRFRYCDVASEVAFLAMDLDRYGRTDLSAAFIDAYNRASNDKGLGELLKFYKCYRAYVRGKVESFKLDDPFIKEKDSALAAAKSYFVLAYRYTLRKPSLILTAGMTGTGKSTIASAINGEIGFTVISSDVTRKELAGIPAYEHHFSGFRDGLYTPEFTRRTYDEMFNRAGKLLGEGQPVVLDATFGSSLHRAEAAKLASKHNADFLVIECVLDESLAQERLEKRKSETTASDGGWETFRAQKKSFDKIIEFPGQKHIILDTAQTVTSLLQLITERI